MTEFSEALKSWRKLRRYSQLELALQADISGRHLSFLETGRSSPSREMVIRLSETLQLPLDARNLFLAQAGFAAKYSEHDWTDYEMQPIRRAVERMLATHMPYPGLAVDRLWRVVDANQAAKQLFGHFGVGIGDSVLDLMLSEVLPAAIENWEEVASAAVERLRAESLSHGRVPELDRAAQQLAQQVAGTINISSPVVPTVLSFGDVRLSLFATIAQFGTPKDVVLDDLKIELYFPMDPETEAFFAGVATNANEH